MRVSLWPGLLRATLENQRRQQDRIRLFEHGARFLPAPAAGGPSEAGANLSARGQAPRGSGPAIREVDSLAGVACGHRMPEQWGLPKEARGAVDFYDVKS